MRRLDLATLLRRGDPLASWSPGRPIAANLIFVLFVVALEVFGRKAAVVAGASLQPPLYLAVIFSGLWLAYPFALHVKLPLVAGASDAGRQGQLAHGWEAGLLVGGLLMSVLTMLVAITSLGFDLDHPLAPLWMIVGVGHGLTVAFLYLGHLGKPPASFSWRRRWEWLADLLLVAYVLLAYAWIWEGMVVGRTPSLASYGWPAVLPQLIAAVAVFWFVYFPLQAPFLLHLAGDLRQLRGGAWLFRASCLAVTVAGLWPSFQD